MRDIPTPQEFDALIRELLRAYAKAAAHPIGSGPKASEYGTTASAAMARVQAAYTAAYRLGERAA